MNTIKTISVAIVGEGVISQEAIHKAVHRFRAEYIDRPSELVVSPAARAELAVITHLKDMMSGYTYPGSPEMYQDMKITVDPKLNQDNEWLVRKTDEKVSALKEIR